MSKALFTSYASQKFFLLFFYLSSSITSAASLTKTNHPLLTSISSPHSPRLNGSSTSRISKRTPKLKTSAIGGIALGIGVILSCLALAVYLFRARCCVRRKKDTDEKGKEKEKESISDVESGRVDSGIGFRCDSGMDVRSESRMSHLRVSTPGPVLLVKRVEGDVLVAAGWNEGFQGGRVVVNQ